MFLLRAKSEHRKAQKTTKGFVERILQDLMHLAKFQPLSVINLLHPPPLPASRS